MGQQVTVPETEESSVEGAWNISWLGLDDETTDDLPEDEEEAYLMIFDPSTAFKRSTLDTLIEETYFTRSELITLNKAFRKECSEGELTFEQFKSYYCKFFPGDAEDYSGLVFRQFDREDKGAITFEDFMRGLSISCRGTVDEKLEWAFRLYDQDADGFVSKQDMITVLEAVFKMLGDKIPFPEGERTPETRAEKLYKSFKCKSKQGIKLKDFVKVCKKDKKVRQGMNMFQNAI